MTPPPVAVPISPITSIDSSLRWFCLFVSQLQAYRRRGLHPSSPKEGMMFKRYPYTIGLVAVISFIVCIVWLFTHDACAHPLGNGLAAWWAFLVVPTSFIAIVEEQGDEQ